MRRRHDRSHSRETIPSGRSGGVCTYRRHAGNFHMERQPARAGGATVGLRCFLDWKGHGMRIGWTFTITALCLFMAPAPVTAFPEKTVTFIVPYAAGGATDVVGRIYAEHMAKVLGQQIVIENSVGAGGTVGTARTAKAAP